ncbi:MAG: hypothetical protein JNJ73_14300, partial [Hyphomonadaceae bacterium]|nr:hypothetical protein [Hyphomonadaceae bacterium]
MPFRSEPPTPPDHAFPDRPAAWDYLRHLISIIQSLFGTPGELTLLGGISDSFRADMASWLRPCERLARLLLFAEAAELKLKPRAIPVPRRGRRAPFGRETCRSPKSETWRVAFKLLPPPSRRGAGARGYFTPSI